MTGTRRWFMGIFIVNLLTVVIAGCWDYRDLERRISVMGIGVDLNNDDSSLMYQVAIEIPNPHASNAGSGGEENGGSGRSNGEKLIIKSNGITIASALLSMAREIDRLPLWEHVLSIVISEDVARDGVAAVVDGFIRSTVVNARARVFVVDGASAEDVVAYAPSLQPLSARFLRSFEYQYSEIPIFARTQDVYSVDARLQEWGVLLLPRIIFSKEGRLAAEGAAVIKDGIFIDWLDKHETEGANWWLDQVHSSTIDFPCPVNPEKHVTLRLKPGGNALNIAEMNGEIEVDARFKATGRIISLAGCRMNPANVSERREMEKAVSNELEQRIMLAIERAQQLNTDFLSAGLHLKRHDPKMWGQLDWDHIFPQTKLTAAVNIAIADPGEWNRPPEFR